ncbi:MAG: 4-oxalomesaconate tautomerase [Alphaproteobacteria bacterium]
MTQTAIPYFFMRGGTSRGPYFNKADLPKDHDKLADVLIAAIGSGHPLNIDGIGGGNAVTTKVAILSRSTLENCDIDYFFAQVSVEDKTVDFKPTCGNIMAAVGPAAIEMGLVNAIAPQTAIRIHAVNTGAKITANVLSDGKNVIYDGDHLIDGVPGTSAPIALNFMEVEGSSTGKFLPTGNLRDVIDGIEVTCMDVAMPMVIARAQAFGLSGHEDVGALNENRDFFDKMEKIRIQAGALMGMGDVTKSVTPKFGLLAPAQNGGTIAARYFMPWSAHPTMAVTGSQCLAACALTAGSVADDMLNRPSTAPATIILEHPMGVMDVIMDWENDDKFSLKSAGLIRSARKIAQGTLFIPKSIWDGQ